MIGHVAAALIVGAVLSAASGLAEGPAQQPQATFRAAVDYVEVDVVVTDASGAFVPGLTAADFELVEDGRPQVIDAFREINVPVERADRTLYSGAIVYPDVIANDATAEGRVYLLVLDDLHSGRNSRLQVRRRAREFVEQYVGSNDLVAVVHTSGRSDVSQDFTANRTLVLRAIDGFMGAGLDSAVENRIEELSQLEQAGGDLTSPAARDRDARERAAVDKATFSAIRNLASHLASLNGRRKAMLFFSDGMDTESPDGPGLSGAFSEKQDVRREMFAAIGAATRANVHIYAIAAGGLSSTIIDASVRSVPSSPAFDALGELAAEKRSMLGALRTISGETGGEAVVDTNNFASGFSRIARDNSTYYLLGFYPSSTRDGKFHRISVDVARPGMTVRARAGYHARNAEKADEKPDRDPLTALISDAVPSAGLPMRLAVPAFKNTTDAARVWMTLEVPFEGLRFEERDGVASEDLLVVYQVLDPGAKVIASSREDVQMRLRPQTRASVEEHGFRVVLPIELKPGRYQVRVAARTTNGARQGSVFADLIVPDFFAGPLAWSGVALTSATSVQMPTRSGNAELAKAFPLMPAAVRTFAPDDTLAFYAEAYDAGAAHAVELTAVIRDDTGKTAFTTTEERTSAELGAGRKGYGFRVDVPLAGLPPGAYVLTLTATSREASDAPATRDIPFTIGIS